MRSNRLLIAMGTLTLTACADEAARGDDDGRTATGEVLGGTISDDMLPLDTVQSQSPPLRDTSSTPSSSANDDPDGQGADEAPVSEAEPPPPPAITEQSSPLEGA